MSFAVGSLFRNKSIEFAWVFKRLKDWDAIRDEMVTSGTLGFRASSSAKRTVRELVDRLRALSDTEVGLVMEGTHRL